jgi:hypothetical protein
VCSTERVARSRWASLAVAAVALVACGKNATDPRKQAEQLERTKERIEREQRDEARRLREQADADSGIDATVPVVDFSDLPTRLAAIAADPEAAVREPRAQNADGTQIATLDMAGCTGGMFEWDPKKTRDVWQFRAICPGLLSNDLAPPGGIDAIDFPPPDGGDTIGNQHLVITAGPLAGIFVNRNLMVPYWTIATVRWRMRGDGSMVLFCAAHRVPGRRFMAEDEFVRRCKSTLEKRVGMACAKFEPPGVASTFDCGWRWKARATCARRLLDEDPIEPTFVCVYDAAKAQVTLTLGK